MKHLIACITLIVLGMFARIAGSVLMLALPSMAAADGVAVRFGVVAVLARLVFIALPYLLLAAALVVSHRKDRLRPRLAYAATAAVVLLPAITFLVMGLAGIPISGAMGFWELFPAIHAAAVLVPYLRAGRELPPATTS